MKPYDIYPGENSKIIVIPANQLMRLVFYEFIGDVKERIKFKRAGSRCMAVATGDIIVFKKPTSNEFHWAYLKNNARILAGWPTISQDNLVENMLEIVEIIQ